MLNAINARRTNKMAFEDDDYDHSDEYREREDADREAWLEREIERSLDPEL
jgi:hypothetical protein